MKQDDSNDVDHNAFNVSHYLPVTHTHTLAGYVWIPTRCMCISTYWCLYVYFDVLHSLHIVSGLFTKLISIFVLTFMLLSLSAFVRFLLKKLLACLL